MVKICDSVSTGGGGASLHFDAFLGLGAHRGLLQLFLDRRRLFLFLLRGFYLCELDGLDLGRRRWFDRWGWGWFLLLLFEKGEVHIHDLLLGYHAFIGAQGCHDLGHADGEREEQQGADQRPTQPAIIVAAKYEGPIILVAVGEDHFVTNVEKNVEPAGLHGKH
jgi:hypothetical protein